MIGNGVVVSCSGCGLHHRVLPHVARKVERGLRSGRCSRCQEQARHRALENRRPLTATEIELHLRWWLDRCDDQQLAAIASGLNGHSLPPDDVARVRALIEG